VEVVVVEKENNSTLNLSRVRGENNIASSGGGENEYRAEENNG
jgi:hypothetical protein